MGDIGDGVVVEIVIAEFIRVSNERTEVFWGVAEGKLMWKVMRRRRGW